MTGPSLSARLRVLVVDDSRLMRRLIRDILESDPALEVIGEAGDGMAAVQMVHNLRPDVVTMDVEMPVLSGLEALGYIMSEIPTPVVMLTGLKDADLAVRALELGAVDFMNKPSGTISVDLFKVKDELLSKVRLAPLANLRRAGSGLEPAPVVKAAPPVKRQAGLKLGWLVVVGASTGGPPALERLFSGLRPDLPAGLLVVQHIPAGFTRSLARRLDQSSPLPVVEAEDGMPVEPGRAYLAAGGSHLVIQVKDVSAGRSRENEYRLHLDDSPPRGSLRPAIDVTMLSAVEAFGPCTLGVILTGMGSDGMEGCRAIRKARGRTIVQDRASSLIYGMPRAVVEQGLAEQVLSLEDIPAAIARVVER
jgi:two-component system, chemotaxis family, protein-glutamate methylesterase/glutaminase